MKFYWLVTSLLAVTLLSFPPVHADETESPSNASAPGQAASESDAAVQDAGDASAASEQNVANKPSEQKEPQFRLPDFYGQIGITPMQRETIYSIQAKYRSQLEELERQIAALKHKQDQEIQSVLSPEQKVILNRLVEAARKRREARRKSTSPESGAVPAEETAESP